jgi:hypothetical protein
MIGPYNPRPKLVTGILVFVLTLVLFFNPPTAYADLADEIEIAIQTAIQGMVGTEFGIDSVTFEMLGVELTMTVIGFSLCEPADPYAPPVSTPVPPLTVYGCENLTTVVADVNNDETNADILIEFSKIFLDLESSRDENLACAPWGDPFPYNGTVVEDGYMLGHASVAVSLELVFEDGCFRVNMVPGSSEFSLTPDVMESRDNCLDSNMDSVLMPILYPLVQDHLDAVFDATLVLLMDEVSDLICSATPNDYSSWGNVKSLYR